MYIKAAFKMLVLGSIWSKPLENIALPAPQKFSIPNHYTFTLAIYSQQIWSNIIYID